MAEAAFSFLLATVGPNHRCNAIGNQVGPLPSLRGLPDNISILLLRLGNHWVAGNCDRSLRSEPNTATAHLDAVQREGCRDTPPPSRHRRLLGNGICERHMDRRAPPPRRVGVRRGGETLRATRYLECDP